MDTSKLKIIICSYAYRDKRIVETIQNAIDLCDDSTRVGVAVVVQDSYQYEILLDKNIYNTTIDYHGWTHFAGFAHHRNNLIKKFNDEYTYFLFIMPGTIFSKSWDNQLINFISNNQDSSLSYDNDVFSLYGTLINSLEINKINYPTYLKMLGEEDDISIKLYCNKHKIISGMDNIITKANPKQWDYVPFSISHRYAQTQRLFLSGQNDFCSVNERYIEYAERYPLKKIFDQRNDSLYTLKDINLENSVSRFLNYKTRI